MLAKSSVASISSNQLNTRDLQLATERFIIMLKYKVVEAFMVCVFSRDMTTGMRYDVTSTLI